MFDDIKLSYKKRPLIQRSGCNDNERLIAETHFTRHACSLLSDISGYYPPALVKFPPISTHPPVPGFSSLSASFRTPSFFYFIPLPLVASSHIVQDDEPRNHEPEKK